MFWLTTRELSNCSLNMAPNLKLPYSRAFGDGLFELRPRGRSGIGRAFYCFLVGKRVVVLPRIYQEIATNTRTRNQARPKAIEGDSKWLI
jgi:phage-related protein